MDGSLGLLERMAMLGKRMLPRVGSTVGGAVGGPAGAAAGQAIGSGVEQLFTAPQDPYGGAGVPIQQGMPISEGPEGSDRFTRALGALAGQGAYQGANALGGAMFGGGEQQPGGEMGSEWSEILKRLQGVPPEEIMQFLQQRQQRDMQGQMQ